MCVLFFSILVVCKNSLWSCIIKVIYKQSQRREIERNWNCNLFVVFFFYQVIISYGQLALQMIAFVSIAPIDLIDKLILETVNFRI